MNEMNEWEIQLRSWAPRRPSARLQRRIFRSRSAEAAIAHPGSTGYRLRWLAPATAALVLLGLIFSQHEGGIASGSTNSNVMVAMILSNQSVAAYLPARLEREQNWPADTFEWTNGSGSTPSMRFLSPMKANDQD